MPRPTKKPKFKTVPQSVFVRESINNALVIRAPFTNADLLCFEADCIAVFFEAFLIKPPI
jgi:hypothetical protein